MAPESTDEIVINGPIKELVAQLAENWTGTFFRAVNISYSRKTDLISGEGSRRLGQRWNPKDIAAVYGAMMPELAVREALQRHLRAIDQLAPLGLVGIDGKFTRAVDLTKPEALAALKTTRHKLLSEDWLELQMRGELALSQRIGKVAAEAGIQALIVPSARASRGRNIVVFPSNLTPDDRLVVQRADLLPQGD